MRISGIDAYGRDGVLVFFLACACSAWKAQRHISSMDDGDDWLFSSSRWRASCSPFILNSIVLGACSRELGWKSKAMKSEVIEAELMKGVGLGNYHGSRIA